MAHIPRLYRQGRIAPGPLLIDGDAAKRLGSVMRARAGDELRLFAGDGREWRAVVATVGRAALQVDVRDVTRQEPPPRLTLELWAGLVRANRFDWIVEKCTEAGADVIRPLLSEHAARGEDVSSARGGRWERIAVEAAEQSGRLFLPAVEPPSRLDDLLTRHHGPLLVADAAGMPWGEATALLPAEGRLAVAIGPEGGFAPGELARARARGALVARLGPNILRTETAAIAAIALLRAQTT